MAKSKVINTVLNLRDNMSGGLLKAARNAKKAGADIDDSMISATRQVIAFKNKSVKAMQDFAKKSAVAAGAAVTGLATAFIALDGATEEYRVAQGKLNTAYEAAGLGADNASRAYSSLYGILGDTDTATEASQLLAKIVKNEGDIQDWTDIAAGAFGTFGDSLPIEGLIEASNETAKVGEVTGVLADALNWAGIMEDDFNKKLSACRSESERTQLITDTLYKTYEDAASAFYQNNGALVQNRESQVALNNTMATLGETSQRVKSKVLEALGANRDGSYRAGSALEWLNQKADAFSSWVSGLDMETLTTQFDQKFAGAVNKAKDALQWCKENSDLLIGGLKLLAGAFLLVKVGQFNTDLKNGISAIGGFIGTIAGMTTATTAQATVTGTATVAQTGLNAAIKANPIGFAITLIEGAIAVGVLLYKNWDTIKQYAGQLWAKVKETFGGIKDSIVGAFNSAKDTVSGFFSWLDDKIESIPLLGSLYSGGKSALSWIGDQLAGNALGTPYWRGGLTRVNERGGEIMNLPNGTQIIPHDISARIAGGPRVTVNVTVAGNVIGNEQYADEMGEHIADKLLRAIENM